jgi:hypothetical protein
MNIKYLIPGFILLLTGCTGFQYVDYENDTNYLTFNHPFTDKDLAKVQSSAERLCRQRKQIVIKTSEKCSLTNCTTNFQCIDQADAVKYGL